MSRAPHTSILTIVLAAGSLMVPAAPVHAAAAPIARPVTISLPVAAAPRSHRSPVYREPASYRGITRLPKHLVPVAGTRPTNGATQLGSSVSLSSTGEHPDVYVDEAGTADVVWNEPRGDDADATMYCRIPRGATRCQTSATLLWNKTYGPGDGPSLNIDHKGPRIVRVGEQLVVLSQRAPTGWQPPVPTQGTSSGTLVAWVSNDGGNTWSDATPVGPRYQAEPVVVGPASDPQIVGLDADPYCGGACITSIRPGTYSAAQGVLDPQPGAGYEPTLASDGARLVMAVNNEAVGSTAPDRSSQMWLRQWNGRDPVTDPANWSVSPPSAGADTHLASGPAGTFLLSRDGISTGSHLRIAQVGSDLALSGMQQVGPDARTTSPTLDEDAGGHLRLAYADDAGLEVRTGAGPGLTLGAVTRVASGQVSDVALSAAADAGGFVVARAGGALTAYAVGNQAPTGQGGVTIGGSGNVTSTAVRFGAFEVRTMGGILLRGTGKDSSEYVSRGAVTLNGLVIEPLNGAQIVLDAQQLTINTLGDVSVRLESPSASVELFRGELARDLGKVAPGTRLFEFPREKFAANVLGFPVSAGLDVYLTATGVRIPVEVSLPREFGSFTGHAVLVGETGKGLHLESLNIRIGPVPLGVAVLDDVSLDWKEGGTWSGHGELILPAGGTITVDVSFVSGDFAHAGFDYAPNPPVAVGPYVYLTSLGGSLSVRPGTVLEAHATAGAGLPVQGAQPVTAKGTFTMTFPDSGPARFRLDGSVSLIGARIADGHLEFVTSGYATFGGNATLGLGPVSGTVAISGFVDGRNGTFGARATAGGQYCSQVQGPDTSKPPVTQCSTSGIDLAMSSVGFAACADIGPLGAGLAAKWSDVDAAALANPATAAAALAGAVQFPTCSTAPYVLPTPARIAGRMLARGAGGASLQLPAGLPTATFLVPGVGGRPSLTVTGPSGQVLVGPGASGDAKVMSMAGVNAVWIGLTAPAAGVYTISPTSDSVDLGQVKVSQGYVPATVKARVSHRGGHAIVRYRVANLGAGQQVTLRETGAFGVHDLGTAHAGTGSLRIRPAAGPGGRRTVEAVVTLDGVPHQIVTVGAFKVRDRSRPGRVTGLRVHKRGSDVRISFRGSRGATRYIVVVRGSAGDMSARLLMGRQHRLVIPGFAWDRRVSVTVRPYSASGAAGPILRRQSRFR